MVTPEWLAANWWLLVIIALAIGFFLGWLFLGRPARNRAMTPHTTSRRRNPMQKASKGSSKTPKNPSPPPASENRICRAPSAKAQADLTQASAQLTAAQEDVTAREGELAEQKLQLTTLRGSVQQAQDAFTNVLEPLQTRAQALATENQNLKANLEGISADLAASRANVESLNETLASKDIALTEAYARAVRLQRDVTDQRDQLTTSQSELASLKRSAARWPTPIMIWRIVCRTPAAKLRTNWPS